MGMSALATAAAAAAIAAKSGAASQEPSKWAVSGLEDIAVLASESAATVEFFASGGRRGRLPDRFPLNAVALALGTVPAAVDAARFMAEMAEMARAETAAQGTAGPRLGTWLDRLSLDARSAVSSPGCKTLRV